METIKKKINALKEDNEIKQDEIDRLTVSCYEVFEQVAPTKSYLVLRTFCWVSVLRENKPLVLFDSLSRLWALGLLGSFFPQLDYVFFRANSRRSRTSENASSRSFML